MIKTLIGSIKLNSKTSLYAIVMGFCQPSKNNWIKIQTKLNLSWAWHSSAPACSFLFSPVFCFWPTLGKLPRLKNCFPQCYGITRRYMQKKIVWRKFYFFNLLDSHLQEDLWWCSKKAKYIRSPQTLVF